MKKHQKHILKRTQLSVAILTILASPVVVANPSGANIIAGQVSIDSSIPGTVSITNSPGSIINWQNFSIAEGEITRFIQQNSQSTVLNRVIGGNPSQIMGQLISNGQVMLINPNGVVFGANAIVNTNGFLASTLAISDQDFLTGNYHFIAGSEADNLFNEGIIRTGEDGNIVLIAPDIQNNGIIQTDGGKIVLAAGQELTITSLDNPQIRYQVQAPDNEVLNLGHILSNGGAIDLFAGTLTHSGEISSESLTLDASGNITLKAESDITLTSSSSINANSSADSGDILVQSTQGTTLISGQITSSSNNSNGGNISLLGNHVGIIESAIVDASGTSGGELLIGGDYRGENSDVQNASATFVGEDVTIKSNADTNGDGGKVIVWADEATRMYGSIEAKGGTESGNGGFVETSGLFLDLGEFAPDVSAYHGIGGTWLLDPYNITITSLTGSLDGSSPNFFANAVDSTISAGILTAALNLGGFVTVETNSGGGQNGDITVDAAISKTIGLESTLTLNAANNIYLNATIEATGINPLNLNLATNTNGTVLGELIINTESVGIGLNGGLLQVSNNGALDATININASNIFFENMIWAHQGVINWNGNGGATEIFGMTGTSFTNEGIFNDNTIASTYAFISGTGGSITNTGTWNKLGTSDTTIATSFINNGTVNINQNSFVLTGTGTDSSGSYVISSSNNALLRFAGNGKILTGTTSITGPVNIYQGNTYFTGGTYDFTTFSLSGTGFAHFQNTASASANTVTLQSTGYLNQSSSNTFVIDTLNLSSGSLSGNGGNVTVNNLFNWTGGGVTLAGTLTTDSLSTSTLTNYSLSLQNTTWNNNGIMNYNGAGGVGNIYDSFNISNNAVLNNNGTFNDNTYSTFGYAEFGGDGTGTINNLGSWYKTGTSPTTFVYTFFNNSGDVYVNRNEFRIINDGTDSGSYNVSTSNNAELVFRSGTRTLTGSSTIAGAVSFTGGSTTFDSNSNYTFNGLLNIAGGDVYFNSTNPVNIDSLSLRGIVDGTGTVNITNSFNWTDGFLLVDDFITALGSTSTLSTSSEGDIQTIQDGTWTNNGTVNWDSNGTDDYFYIINASLDNEGTFNDNTTSSSSNTLGGYPTGTINNTGTWNKTGASPYTVISSPFNNSGSVYLTSGSLEIQTSQNSPGSFDVANGTQLYMIGSSITLDHPNDFTGLGGVFFGAESAITFESIQDGAYDLATTFIIDNGPLSLFSFDTANISNGTLIDNLDGTMTYTPNTGFSGTSDFFTFVIADTANESFADGMITMNIANSSSSYTWSGPTSGTADWNNPAFWGGVVPSNGSDVTIPFVSGNLTIQYSAGSLALNTLTSNESLLVTGGTLTLGDALADSSSFASGTSFSLSGGSFGGAGSIDILGNFNWTGGTLTGSGDLDLSSASSISLSGTLTQAGMNITFPSINLGSGVTYNLSGGSFNTTNYSLSNGATMNLNGGSLSSSGNISISGAFNWASGGITNSGTMTVGTNGIVSISGNTSTSQSTVVNNGTIKKTGGTGTATISSGSFTNAGSVESQSGTLNLGSTYIQSSGTTTLNGGNILASNTTFNGGTLKGTGTLTSSVINNATIAPGFSPGTITIDGDFTQGSTGVLTMEIAGTSLGAYDRLIVTGDVNLDGTLNIIPISPYTLTAVVGDQFNLISAGTMFGDFSSVITSAGYAFTTDYFAAVYTATTSLVASTPITQPIVNTVVGIQTTDVLTLTDQAILDPTLELTPDSSTEDPDDSNVDTETSSTLASNDEVEGTLMICY